jgi:hypothetical protein
MAPQPKGGARVFGLGGGGRRRHSGRTIADVFLNGLSGDGRASDDGPSGHASGASRCGPGCASAFVGRAARRDQAAERGIHRHRCDGADAIALGGTDVFGGRDPQRRGAGNAPRPTPVQGGHFSATELARADDSADDRPCVCPRERRTGAGPDSADSRSGSSRKELTTS